ncbi:MAG: threonine/serine dehydratase [Gemmatimonadetes bacterium]|uniref:Threonine/serine dehydratase n=1 Tax=Candidatus Kutchimonas denitrificans TaxID=3056748 RepID=A0AAE4ZBZ4_9BACT|nr:threonine/serine dehydratase [Gemmatimonadota bacterium]NIR76482.1 threonine/serine dehydratase [Candidatus Kutchimonas denitrificans]NIS03300.1 threonine/serine dehydratase [Gemmatimonadota bacterium]NIT69161.1 threonine/serine dehydratase [Gemmatimonadota bacterium]NIU54553.1 pyridoxal-phosphate dependent enzyme [Gemmatimonadota bacterium]
MERLVSLEEIQGAADRIRGVVRRTPLLAERAASFAEARRPRIKCENLQRGGAFKLRGAYNFVAQLPEEERSRGVITYSSGNHGRAVALAAADLGVPATVVVPEDAPGVKVEAIRRLGAEVIFEGTTSVERRRRAEAVATERELAIVPPFDHRQIIAGQGTVGLEIAEDWPVVEQAVVPVGGGGLLAGIATALMALVPDARVFGVEPAGAASMARSLEAGEPVELESVASVADGLKPVRPGDLTFAHARVRVAGVIELEDEEILRGLAWCAEEYRLVVEPSGAAAVAAVLAGKLPDPQAPTVAVISGGNVDPEAWSRWVREYSRETNQTG